MVEKDSEKIYSFGYSLLMFSTFFAMFFGMGIYIMFSLTKNDTFVASILGACISCLMFLIVKFIVSRNDCENIYELNKQLFGNVFGSVLNTIMWIGFFFIATIVLYNIADFFNTEYLPETSIDYLKILVVLPVIYVCTKNLSTLIRMNQILSVTSIFLIILDMIGISGSFDLSNLEPVLASEKVNLFKSVITYSVLTIVPYSMLLICGKKHIKDDNKLNKNLNIMFIFTNIVKILIILSAILTLGMEFIDIFRFPEYITLKQFTLFNILERMENILALQFYFNSLSALCLLYYFIIKLIPETKFKRYYSIIIAIVQVVITKIIFKNTITFIEFIQSSLIYIILITIFLPIIINFFELKVKKY